MAFHQLLSLLILVYFVSAAIFVGARMLQMFGEIDDKGGGITKAEEFLNGTDPQIGMVVIFSVMAWMRLLVKIGMAVRITKEVGLQ